MREFMQIVESVLAEGRVHEIDTGYNGVYHPVRIYQSPSRAQATTLATKALRSGLIYLRGIQYMGKTVYICDGADATHDDMLKNFLPHVESHSSDFTAFEIRNYKMLSMTPTVGPVEVVTVRPGDYDAETNPIVQGIVQACTAVLSSREEPEALTEFTRPNEMEDAEPVLHKAGWVSVGAGYYGAVYAKEGLNYVLKLFDERDSGYKAFIKLVQNNPNKHFPVFKGKLVRITENYLAIRMEKLVHAPANAPHLGVYLTCRDKGPHAGNQPQVDAYHRVIAYLEGEPELKKALDLIIDNLLTKYSSDLHGDDTMQRADGTLVIIDPVGFRK